MMRKSFKFPESKNDTVLTVKTLCAEKWLLIDRETGQIYQGNSGGYWDRLNPVIKFDKEDL
jgi:hypothetical protein